MGAFPNPTAIAVIYKQFFKQRGNAVEYKMMNDPVPKIGSKDLSFYRFINNKADAGSRLIDQVGDIIKQRKYLVFKFVFKCQGINGIALVFSGVKISPE